jgi:hypothetical protein
MREGGATGFIAAFLYPIIFIGSGARFLSFCRRNCYSRLR